jgi:hypothetical protein
MEAYGLAVAGRGDHVGGAIGRAQAPSLVKPKLTAIGHGLAARAVVLVRRLEVRQSGASSAASVSAASSTSTAGPSEDVTQEGLTAHALVARSPGPGDQQGRYPTPFSPFALSISHAVPV